MDVATMSENREGGASKMTSTSGPHDFEALFRDAGPGVWRALFAYTGGRRDIADEAVAEAFARAIAYTRGIRDPLAWIYRTAFRIAAEEMRNDAARSFEPDTTVEPPELDELMQRPLAALAEPARRHRPAVRGGPERRRGRAPDGDRGADRSRAHPSRQEATARAAGG